MNPRMVAEFQNKSFIFRWLYGLQLAEQEQDQHDDQNNANQPRPGMAEAIAAAAEPAREAAEQDHDQDDDEDQSKRHGAALQTAAWRASDASSGPEQSIFQAAGRCIGESRDSQVRNCAP